MKSLEEYLENHPDPTYKMLKRVKLFHLMGKYEQLSLDNLLKDVEVSMSYAGITNINGSVLKFCE